MTDLARRGSRTVERSRGWWGLVLAAIVLGGLASRAGHTGFVLVDKYLGDALYAAMIYAGLRVFGVRYSVGWIAMAIMVAIECFQMTGIPAQMFHAGQPLPVRVAGRLLGTHFAWTDLVAYAAGILAIDGVVRRVRPL